MEPFSAWILPLLLSGAALWGARRRVDVYDALVTGGKSGLQVAVSILPALATLLTAVYMLRASGALDALTALLAPALTVLGVPPETAPLLVIRPLSGYGPDSYIGRCAAVMLGCTETTFYTVAVYFGAAGIKRTRYTIPAALTADLAAYLAAAWAVRLFFET